MNKVYHDLEGNARTISQMVRAVPEWAANRIQQGERAAERIAELEAALAEAIEDIEDWASYADEYFREKHDLQGCLEKHRAKLDAQQKEKE